MYQQHQSASRFTDPRRSIPRDKVKTSVGLRGGDVPGLHLSVKRRKNDDDHNSNKSTVLRSKERSNGA